CQTLSRVNCDNVGQTLAVQVVGIDPNGNTNNCTAQVSVVGMPCGFEATDIDCENGASATYDPVAESFTLTASDCAGYPHGEYSIVKSELCGDGEIITQISSLNGDGRAGLIMMENADSETRFVSIIKDLTNRVRTEYRSASGGSISYKSKNRSGVDWLRIVRDGSKFKTYTSTNGYYWRLAHSINFSDFDDCIQVGMLVYTKNANGPISATFSNVKIAGDNNSALEQISGNPAPAVNAGVTQIVTTSQLADIGLNVAPNPFADQTQIAFTLPKASDVTMVIYNLHGQRVQNLEDARLDAGTHRYRWDGRSGKGESLPTGIYMLRLRVDKKWFTTKVSLINR
ncbi:MAG: T9SS type A sorting domain-containing protein, partial [Cyanothece sp. SIO1E1]|nr:T9SS type A sorting domain-containing protein [Cyanothece sp. SIO1E1]